MASRPGRTPDPLDFRFHRPLGGPDDTYKEGVVLANGVAVTCIAPIAGALIFRIRGKQAAAGTLSFAYLRPASVRATNAATTPAYALPAGTPHADVAVLANTEFLVDIEPAGESEVLITMTPGGNGAVNFLDGMQQ